MFLSRRSRRRLIAVAVLAGVAAGGIMAWKGLRRAQVGRLTVAARAEGMEAYRDGDYEKALGQLSYYYTRRKNDLEALLAFADTRGRIPQEHDVHLMESAGLYRAALRLDAGNREALDHLLAISRRLDWRARTLEYAERLLELDPAHRDALAARAAGLLYSGRYDEALAGAERLVSLEPDDLEWRSMVLEVMHRRGDSPSRLMARCDGWLGEGASDGRYHDFDPRPR